MAVALAPDRLPEDEGAQRAGLTGGSAGCWAMRPRAIGRSVEPQLKALPYSTATVKQDVSDQLACYLLEHHDDFRGADVERVFLRQYPHHEIGAHLFGTVGEMTAEQQKDPRYRDVDLGDRVGQSGIELQYDRFLRGRNGASRVQVDALGNLNRPLREGEPEQGRQLRLSVDLDVQEAGQQALAGGTGPGPSRSWTSTTARCSALAPSRRFDPNVFSKGDQASATSTASTTRTTARRSLNRAIQGGYPTGSTFKLITATAALESGLITPDTVLTDPALYTVGGVTFKNAGGVAHGALALRQALTVSSDVFFYQLGDQLNSAGDGLALQHWAHRLGIGREPASTSPASCPGLLPTPKWRDDLYKAARPNGPGAPGDNVNLSVGPGRPEGRPDADGRGLRGDRQRRTRAAPAPGPADRGLLGPRAPAARGPAPPASSRSARVPPGHPRRAARRRERAGGHLDRRVPRLPDPGRRQDRHGRAAPGGPTSPGTWRSRPTPSPNTWWP